MNQNEWSNLTNNRIDLLQKNIDRVKSITDALQKMIEGQEKMNGIFETAMERV